MPVSGNGSEVLDWVEEACDAGGYTGAISVACEAVASSRSALTVPSSEGRWMVRGRCERVQGYCRNVLVAPEGVTASSMAAARGMWCRCGSVELPICRRMRGSGWRMGGVSWCAGQCGRRALRSGVLASVGIALQIFVGVRGRGRELADGQCGAGRHNVRDGVSGRGRRRGRGVWADRARGMWWGRCGCVRGGVLCVGGMAL